MICVEELKCDFRDAQIGDERFSQGRFHGLGIQYDTYNQTARYSAREKTAFNILLFFGEQRLRLVLSVSPLFCSSDTVLLCIALRR
jgi:hypothetical protein